jgi:hypothetical protein
MEDEPITVTKNEVMVEVVRPLFVEVGEVGARLFWEIDDGDDDEVVAVAVVVGAEVEVEVEVWDEDEDETDEVVEVDWDVGIELEVSELVDEMSNEDVTSSWDDL